MNHGFATLQILQRSFAGLSARPIGSSGALAVLARGWGSSAEHRYLSAVRAEPL